MGVCHCLDVTRDCRFGVICHYRCLGVTFVFRRRGAAFIVRVIQTSKLSPIRDNKSNQWLSICCRTGVIDILVIIVISNV